MSKKDLFKSTAIPNLREELLKKFPSVNPEAVFENACNILKQELIGMDDRGNRAIRKHLSKNILPGFACYKALISAGIPTDTAIEFTQIEMCKGAQGMANFCTRLSNKKHAYSIFTKVFSLGMKIGFPKEGWTVVMHEKSKQRTRFDITTCLYCEELQKRSAMELCGAFCQTDHTSYDPLTPGVIFKRKGTLAEGNKVCDFCFENGRK
jgi:hypothetical protein